MLVRMMFPYIFLMLIVLGYLYYRYMKLGSVLLRVERVLLTRYNIDSLLMIILIAASSYLLARYELRSNPATDETLVLGPLTYVFFYGALLIAVIGRELERPALREKGISSSRGFWLWPEIDSFRWSKDVLTINIIRGRKKRSEVWQIKPSKKKDIDLVLKKMVQKRASHSKKKN